MILLLEFYPTEHYYSCTNYFFNNDRVTKDDSEQHYKDEHNDDVIAFFRIVFVYFDQIRMPNKWHVGPM